MLNSSHEKEYPMPNKPEPAREKRTPPRKRQNAQDDHEGSAHRPEEFDEQDPEKQKETDA